MGLKTPLYVLGYDRLRFFSVHDLNKVVYLPLFTDPAAAEKYRKYFSRRYGRKVHSFLIRKPLDAIGILSCIQMSDSSVQYVALNPDIPVGDPQVECYTLAEAISALGRHSPKRIQKPKTGHSPRSKRDGGKNVPR